jgi:hypothetical protein
MYREFQRALALKNSLYVERFFQLFDDNADGFINFDEFILGLSILSTRGSQEEKITCKLKLIYQVHLTNLLPFLIWSNIVSNVLKLHNLFIE